MTKEKKNNLLKYVASLQERLKDAQAGQVSEKHKEHVPSFITFLEREIQTAKLTLDKV